jgi:DNA-binding transcriptional ArsR family regulator
MYTKDFASLLHLLALSQQSGTLLVLRKGEAWQACLQLLEGQPLSCIIVAIADGSLLMSGEQALQWLERQGELQWHLVGDLTTAPTAVLPAPSPSEATQQPEQSAQELFPPATPLDPFPPLSTRSTRLIARRIRQPSDLIIWSRERRQVFALIDGSRSVSEIARLLGRSPEQVMALLGDLLQQGLITLEERL